MTPLGLRVLSPGPSSTVQDLGRRGWFHAGVGVAGAADRGSFRLANRLVGNPESAAAIECVLGGVTLECTGPAVLAVTGAPVPIRLGGRVQPPAAVLHARRGQRLEIGTAAAGLRCYVAVRGGIDVAPVLGSRSRDTLAGLGPEPLRAGDLLPVGAGRGAWPEVEVAPVAPIASGVLTARARPGPRADWFVRPEALFEGHWRITDETDRIGARLDRVPDGPPLRRRDRAELPTEGMPLGAVQVSPSGQPVVFLADHPLTGGYPVVATVLDADVDLFAQARPGRRVRFRAVP